MAIKTMILILDGVSYTLLKNPSTGKYEAEITAPTKSSYNQPGNKYDMVLKVTDQAGNVTTIDKNHATFGEKMKLDANEKIAPIIMVTNPGASAYLTANSVQIQFDVTDNDSGVNSSSISLQIDSQALVTTAITRRPITGGYRCTYSSTIMDGKHTIKVNAKDNDGNSAVQKMVEFTVDTVPPTLNISNPVSGLITNQQSCTVRGATNDATSAPCIVTVKLNNTDQGVVTLNADGAFEKIVTWVKGSNTIYVKSTDKAGKYSEITRTVIYDPDAPVVNSIEITPNPVGTGAIFKIVVDAID